MTNLVKIPMAGGESVVVEKGDEQLARFAPAAVDPGEVVGTAIESFESAWSGCCRRYGRSASG